MAFDGRLVSSNAPGPAQPLSASSHAPGPTPQAVENVSQGWQCSLCRLTNDESRMQCQLCGASQGVGNSGQNKETNLDFTSEAVKQQAMRTKQMHAEVEHLSSLAQRSDPNHISRAGLSDTSTGPVSGAVCTTCSELLYQTNIVLDTISALTSDVLRAGLPGGASNPETVRVGLRGLIGQVLDTCNNGPRPEIIFKDERLRLTHGMLEDFFGEIGGSQSSISRRPPTDRVEGQHSPQRSHPSIQSSGQSQTFPEALPNGKRDPQPDAKAHRILPASQHQDSTFERGGTESSSAPPRPFQDRSRNETHQRDNGPRHPELDFGPPTTFASNPNRPSDDVFNWWTSDPLTLASKGRHRAGDPDMGESLADAVQWSWWDEDEAHRRATRDPISPGLQEARTIKEWMSNHAASNPNDFSRLQHAHQFLRSTLEETGIKNAKRRPVTGRRGTEPFLLPTEDKVEHASYRDAEDERRRLINNSTRLPETLQDAVDKLDERTCGPTPWLLPADQSTATGTGYLEDSRDY